MRDKIQTSQGGLATARRPRLVVAGAAGVACRAVEQLQKRDWEVYAISSADAVRAALTQKPTAMILPEETALESGYLLAAKVKRARPKVKVIVIGRTRTPEAERFARFAGATLLAEADGVARLLAVLDH